MSQIKWVLLSENSTFVRTSNRVKTGVLYYHVPLSPSDLKISVQEPYFSLVPLKTSTNSFTSIPILLIPLSLLFLCFNLLGSWYLFPPIYFGSRIFVFYSPRICVSF